MTAAKKITLSSSRDISFNRLVLSQSNVRKIVSGVSIEELAEDIARRTLLQSLNVRPILDADGNETGNFEIPAGGRRYRALELLVKQKRLSKTALIPCVVRDPSTSILAEDDSLAENVQRAPLHPLDQYRAFQTLRDKGMSVEDIAAAFFVAPRVVQQRLRLAAVSTKLLDLYAADQLTLEQLMAFTVVEDHTRQEQVWAALEKSWNKEAHQIRRMLTEKAVPSDDRRAVFVTLETYEAGGGSVLKDLFAEEGGGYLEDAPLLEKLVAERLRREAEQVAEEGWKWVDARADLAFGFDRCFERLMDEPVALTAEEEAAIAALQTERDELTAQYEEADEIPEAVDRRLTEIDEALERFEARPPRYLPADMARAGAFVSIDRDGGLRVERGYVKPEDRLAPAAAERPAADPIASVSSRDQDPAAFIASHVAIVTVGGATADSEEGEDDAILKPLPEKLMTELTAHRTVALRDALATQPRVALTALLHKFVSEMLRLGAGSADCVQASLREVYLTAQAPDLKTSPSAVSVEARQEAWEKDIPCDDQALWDWLKAQSDATRLMLLAHCVGLTVNALFERTNAYGGATSASCVKQRMCQADRLARAVGLDMVEAGWRPTVDNYLGRVPKVRILEAVREGAGDRAAELIAHLKKSEMATEAERLLADTGWLPEPLRLVDDTNEPGLPDFLAGGEDEGEAADIDPEALPEAAE
jgi:ParB family chromosome partitioning protein